MNNDQIKEIALANGFKLKEQPSGKMDKTEEKSS